jgi:hypothetical protein
VPATFAVSQDGTYLIETFIGVQTAQMLYATGHELIEYLQTTGIRNVLVDARAQPAPLPTIDAHDLWDALAPRMPVGVKLAVLVTWEMKGYTFGETVAVNRRVNVRNFNEYDQALAWLGVNSDGADLTGENRNLSYS